MGFLFGRGATHRRGAGVRLALLMYVARVRFLRSLLLIALLLRWRRLAFVGTPLLVLLLRRRIGHGLKSALRSWLGRAALSIWRPGNISRGRKLTIIIRRLQRLRPLIHPDTRLHRLVWRLRSIVRRLRLLTPLLRLQRLLRFIYRTALRAWRAGNIARRRQLTVIRLRLQRLRMLVHPKARLLRSVGSLWSVTRRLLTWLLGL